MDNRIAYLAMKDWPGKVVTCPTRGSAQVGFLKNQSFIGKRLTYKAPIGNEEEERPEDAI
jgi:hypothetical protein